jgi:hypothetical protein
MQPFHQSEESNPTAASTMPMPLKGQVTNDLIIPGLRDVAVRDYSAWHEANVSDDSLKAQFRQTCNVALANGLDLRMIHKDQDPSFFIDKGIMVGIARQFVRDIGEWVKCVRDVSPVDQATQAAA